MKNAFFGRKPFETLSILKHRVTCRIDTLGWTIAISDPSSCCQDHCRSSVSVDKRSTRRLSVIFMIPDIIDMGRVGNSTYIHVYIRLSLVVFSHSPFIGSFSNSDIHDIRIPMYTEHTLEPIITFSQSSVARPVAQLVERWTPGSESPGSRCSGARYMNLLTGIARFRLVGKVAASWSQLSGTGRVRLWCAR